MELQDFDVEFTIQFYRPVTAKSSDYALQKGQHLASSLTPGQLLETAAGTSVVVTKVIPRARETRRLHGTRDTGWPHTAEDRP